jgi:hypothetical protein
VCACSEADNDRRGIAAAMIRSPSVCRCGRLPVEAGFDAESHVQGA